MRRAGHLIFVVLALVCFGCAHPDTISRTGLFAHLSVSHPQVTRLDEAEITVIVRNYGPTNATINTYALESDVLSINVLNSKGEILAPVPASIPPPDVSKYRRVLSPGASQKFSYHGLSYEVETPPGRYTVRMRHIPSDQIVLTIR